MTNKRLDGIYQELVKDIEKGDLNEPNEILKKFKKSLTQEDLARFYKLLKDKDIGKLIHGEVPYDGEGVFNIVGQIEHGMMQITTLLALEAILFDRDKYHAKSSMCKFCKKVRMQAFGKYERIKALLDDK